MHLYFMVYKVSVRLPLCKFLYKMRICLCSNGVTIHRAVWVLHCSQLSPFSSDCASWTTSSTIFCLKLHGLFLFWFQLCHHFRASTVCCGQTLWVWVGENAGKEAEQSDQHPWQSEAVCGLSLVHPCLWASWQRWATKQHYQWRAIPHQHQGHRGEGMKTKGSRDWHQDLVLGGNQNPKNVFLSSSLKSLLSFCLPPPLALESLSYNRKIVSLLIFSVAQHWAPFPEQVF